MIVRADHLDEKGGPASLDLRLRRDSVRDAGGEKVFEEDKPEEGGGGGEDERSLRGPWTSPEEGRAQARRDITWRGRKLGLDRFPSNPKAGHEAGEGGEGNVNISKREGEGDESARNNEGAGVSMEEDEEKAATEARVGADGGKEAAEVPMAEDGGNEAAEFRVEEQNAGNLQGGEATGHEIGEWEKEGRTTDERENRGGGGMDDLNDDADAGSDREVTPQILPEDAEAAESLQVTPVPPCLSQGPRCVS